MGVGGVRGGGKRGGVGGSRGPGGAGKTSGTSFGGKVDKTEAVESTSGAVGAGPAAAAKDIDPITPRAMEIVRMLKSGEISSRDEATKRLVSDILKQKLRMQSKALTQRIADALQDDPRLNKRLERLWASEDSKG